MHSTGARRRIFEGDPIVPYSTERVLYILEKKRNFPQEQKGWAGLGQGWVVIWDDKSVRSCEKTKEATGGFSSLRYISYCIHKYGREGEKERERCIVVGSFLFFHDGELYNSSSSDT